MKINEKSAPRVIFLSLAVKIDGVGKLGDEAAVFRQKIKFEPNAAVVKSSPLGCS